MPRQNTQIFLLSRVVSLQSALLLLGFLEFSAAAILILQIDPDPKNAVLFGYSLSRLVLFLQACIPAAWLLALFGLGEYRARVLQSLEIVLQKRLQFCGLVLFTLALLGLIVWLLPVEMLGKYSLFFVRARPLLLAVSFFPAQFSINWLVKTTRIPTWTFWRPELIFMAALLTITGLILITGLGITPEREHWAVAGIPLTSLQLCAILLAGVLFFGLLGLITPRLFVHSPRILDLLIALALLVGTILWWTGTPNRGNDFSSRPEPPTYQVFPKGDAKPYDLGAISVLKGFGINFRAYTDKPMYTIFLALLHVVAGYDYTLLAWFHASFLALMVPFLYLFGKAFHSRLFGLLLAGITLVRQQNGILLTNAFNYHTTPSQFMTEVPTLLGVIVSTGLMFYWMRSSQRSNWWAFVTGAALGAVSLVRQNPFLIILGMPVLLLFALHKRKKAWLIQSVFFFLGCAVLIGPWLVIGKEFFFYKLQLWNLPIRTGYELPVLNRRVFGKFSDANLRPHYAGLTMPDIDIQTFPGFVFNHTLHNFVGSFLTLPDSISPADQQLNTLIQRPYWSEGHERVTLGQIPFLFINFGLLAFGLGWAWKRWRWAGLGPLFVFGVYGLANGFARSSGSRYLVPMDWGVSFYFALGLVCTFQILPKVFRQLLQAEPQDDGIITQPVAVTKKTLNWLNYTVIGLIVFVAALIPAAQTLIPPSTELCSPVDPAPLQAALPAGQTVPIFLNGIVLYPVAHGSSLDFDLFSCGYIPPISIENFKSRLESGQYIIAGLSDNGASPRLLLLAIPGEQGQPPQVLWRAGQ